MQRMDSWQTAAENGRARFNECDCPMTMMEQLKCPPGTLCHPCVGLDIVLVGLHCGVHREQQQPLLLGNDRVCQGLWLHMCCSLVSAAVGWVVMLRCLFCLYIVLVHVLCVCLHHLLFAVCCDASHYGLSGSSILAGTPTLYNVVVNC